MRGSRHVDTTTSSTRIQTLLLQLASTQSSASSDGQLNPFWRPVLGVQSTTTELGHPNYLSKGPKQRLRWLLCCGFPLVSAQKVSKADPVLHVCTPLLTQSILRGKRSWPPNQYQQQSNTPAGGCPQHRRGHQQLLLAAPTAPGSCSRAGPCSRPRAERPRTPDMGRMKPRSTWAAGRPQAGHGLCDRQPPFAR